MGKALSGYKDKIIKLAIQHSGGSINVYCTLDDLSAKLRTKVEFTGNPDKDFTNLVSAIAELLTELKSASYL